MRYLSRGIIAGLAVALVCDSEFAWIVIVGLVAAGLILVLFWADLKERTGR